MFEYEGNEYSLEDVKLAASNLNMGFDEYVKKYNLKEKGKANGVAQQDAAVTLPDHFMKVRRSISGFVSFLITQRSPSGV